MHEGLTLAFSLQLVNHLSHLHGLLLLLLFLLLLLSDLPPVVLNGILIEDLKAQSPLLLSLLSQLLLLLSVLTVLLLSLVFLHLLFLSSEVNVL